MKALTLGEGFADFRKALRADADILHGGLANVFKAWRGIGRSYTVEVVRQSMKPDVVLDYGKAYNYGIEPHAKPNYPMPAVIPYYTAFSPWFYDNEDGFWSNSALDRLQYAAMVRDYLEQ